jgi:AcrR family transcriptional regulator
MGKVMISNNRQRQVRKTRALLLDAFRELVLERRYTAIRVADIVARADVGRSTFYEHFNDKDDILFESMSGLLAVLADIGGEKHHVDQLARVLGHFREHRRLALGLLSGPSPRVARKLTQLIQEHLGSKQGRSSSLLPINLIAQLLAEANLGLIRGWLENESQCTAMELASAMHASAKASLNAIL